MSMCMGLSEHWMKFDFFIHDRIWLIAESTKGKLLARSFRLNKTQPKNVLVNPPPLKRKWFIAMYAQSDSHIHVLCKNAPYWFCKETSCTKTIIITSLAQPQKKCLLLFFCRHPNYLCSKCRHPNCRHKNIYITYVGYHLYYPCGGLSGGVRWSRRF
jgi:hypothetical protein